MPDYIIGYGKLNVSKLKNLENKAMFTTYKFKKPFCYQY